MLTDLDLSERLSRGDFQVLEEFYRVQAPRLRNFLLQVLGNQQAAEDVAQEACLELWKRPNGFNPARGTLKAYLFGIARKRASEWRRRHRSLENHKSVEGATTELERTVLVREAFARLDPDLRALLWLREIEGYSYEELAHIFDIPLGTVKSRLFNARERLRQLWHRDVKRG